MNVSKKQRPINFKIGTYLQDVVLVTWPNLVKVGQRSWSYEYIMYSDKMCYNFITGGHINFVLGGKHEDNPRRVRHEMFAMKMPVA